MKLSGATQRKFAEYLWPVLVLSILLLYSYARFFVVPYLGFQFDGSSGEIVEIFTERPSSNLDVGDRILFIDGVPWSAYQEDVRLNIFGRYQPGDSLELNVVTASGGAESIQWQIPGFTFPEFFSRLINTWWLSYVFWLAGTATLLLVRPKDERWALLIAFNYVTAIWFMAGTLSSRGVFESPFVLRAGVWMSLPIYLHLHWILPRPLRSIPRVFWIGLYLVCAGFAAAHWIGVIPSSAYLIPFSIAVLGSVLLLLFRFVFRSTERREIGLLFVSAAVALAPALAVALASLFGTVPSAWPGYLLSLLALPGAYFYVVYRRQLGGLELRANRLISLYLFLILLVTLSLLALPLISVAFETPQSAAGAVLLAGIAAALVSVLGFPGFQRLVEKRLLNISEPPERTLQTFAGRLSTSFTRDNLVDILQKEVLPSLLIRQSALIGFSAENPNGEPIYLQSVKSSELPKPGKLKEILDDSLRRRNKQQRQVHLPGGFGWIQASLPLVVGKGTLGLWLLGRKDPDDHYSQTELDLLESLANQMAIALANITLAERLRALYQADIDRQEEERAHLARELHDEVLDRFNDLLGPIADQLDSRDFDEKRSQLDDYVRGIIEGLRPPTLDFGLYHALHGLVDELSGKPYAKARLSLELAKSEQRFDKKVEQHLFRVVQQASENALLHGRAKEVSIQGHIDAHGAEFSVADDGQGFEIAHGADLVALLAARHFGLVGMHERAQIIGAHLTIESQLGTGTRIQLNWREKNGGKPI